jgi:hypothetical protein
MSPTPCRRARTLSSVARTCALPLAVVVGGCVPLDDPGLLHDLRVLAVVTEPAELALPPLFFEESVFLENDAYQIAVVDIDVFAFEPRGGLVEMTTRACPTPSVDNANGCENFDPASAYPALVDRQAFDAFFATNRAGAAPLAPSADPAGRVPFSRESRAITLAVAHHLFRAADGGSGDDNKGVFAELSQSTGTTGTQPGRRFNLSGLRALNIPFLTPILPRFDVTVVNDARLPHEVSVEHAYKRMPMFIDLFLPLPSPFAEVRDEIVVEIESALGVPFCDPSTLALPDAVKVNSEGELVDVDDNLLDVQLGPWHCLFPRRPNQNPTMQGILLLRDSKPDKPVIGEGSVTPIAEVGVRRGDAISVAPTFFTYPELHQSLSWDIDAERIVVRNVIEDYVVDFAVTGGVLERAQTVPVVDAGLGITWLLPRDRELGSRDTIVLTVRDQRGGTSVGILTVIYE